MKQAVKQQKENKSKKAMIAIFMARGEKRRKKKEMETKFYSK